MSRHNRLGSLTVCAWLLLAVAIVHPPDGTTLRLCYVRELADVPCPGCGLTRSVSCAVRGDLNTSVAQHPFGIVVLAAAATVALVSLLPRSGRQRITDHVHQHRSFLKRSGWVIFFLFLIYGTARIWLPL